MLASVRNDFGDTDKGDWRTRWSEIVDRLIDAVTDSVNSLRGPLPVTAAIRVQARIEVVKSIVSWIEASSEEGGGGGDAENQEEIEGQEGGGERRDEEMEEQDGEGEEADDERDDDDDDDDDDDEGTEEEAIQLMPSSEVHLGASLPVLEDHKL